MLLEFFFSLFIFKGTWNLFEHFLDYNTNMSDRCNNKFAYDKKAKYNI